MTWSLNLRGEYHDKEDYDQFHPFSRDSLDGPMLHSISLLFIRKKVQLLVVSTIIVYRTVYTYGSSIIHMGLYSIDRIN